MFRVPKGKFSRAVTRPRWYVEQLVDRPAGVAKRGPWRRTWSKVEDAERLDALALYRSPDARPRRTSIRRRRDHRGRVYGVFRHHAPGSRTINGSARNRASVVFFLPANG